MTYKEIVDDLINNAEWVEEDKFLSIVVRKKYDVAKASSSRKNSVLSILKQGLDLGEYRKGISEEGRLFWSKGEGERQIVVLSSVETRITSSQEILIANARSLIKETESFLQKTCVERLKQVHGDQWVANMPTFIIEKLNSHLVKRNRNPWTKGSLVDPLEVASITDFAEIIAKNWRAFSTLFIDKEITVGRLKELGYFRNAVQHNTPINHKELAYFCMSAELFLDKFSKQ